MMKVFLKQNKLSLIVYIVMFILIGLGVNEYQKEYGYKVRMESWEEQLKQCEENFSSMTLEEQEYMQKKCNNLKNTEFQMDDTITIFFYILFTKSLYYLSMIVPLFIIICSIYKWHSYLKNGFIKNLLMRETYFKMMKKTLLDCYKKILVFLGFILLIFVISYFISGHFDYTEGLNFGGLVEHDFYNNMPYSFITFLLVLALSYALYINIAMISAKYNKNYYVCVLVAYLLWFGLEILVEVVIGGYILWVCFGISTNGTFSLLALYTTWKTKESLIQLGLTFLLAVSSFIILYFVYRSKEGVVIASER